MATGTVLVVDDDPVIVQLLQVNFELEGYEVLTAASGPEALESARARPPALVVMDVMMPGMSGLDAARALRGDTRTASLPVLLLSAKAQSADIAAGLEVADDYLTKPFDPFELLDRAAELIERADDSGSLRASRPRP